MRMTEPISFTVIFPFVNQMLRTRLPPSIPDSQLGYYAGFVESAFALAQFLTIFFWARLSDRIGRKPVLLIGYSAVVSASMRLGLQRRSRRWSRRGALPVDEWQYRHLEKCPGRDHG